MRIISGIYKNQTIYTPDDEKTHPMGNREKIALFNMLLPYLPSSTVLDAFSGSGALGLEAISRGANNVSFVEKSPKAAKNISKNINKLKIPSSTYEIIIKDVKKINFAPNSFDIIIADPPYNNFKIEEIEHLVKFLKPSGIFALSSPKDTLINLPLELISSHTYAAARISLFKKV